MAHKSNIRHTWQYNKMMALVRSYDFKSIDEYHQYIIDSKINGQVNQCCRLFKQMPKEYRKDFLSYLVDETKEIDYHNDREPRTYYYELLKLLIEEI